MLSGEVINLIQGLLVKDKKDRYSHAVVQDHPWFSSFNAYNRDTTLGDSGALLPEDTPNFKKVASSMVVENDVSNDVLSRLRKNFMKP